MPNYQVTQTTGATIAPGTVDTGNHSDDRTTQITLPFPVTIYDQTFTTANVSTNGNLQFVGNDVSGSNTNLPTLTTTRRSSPFGTTYLQGSRATASLRR